MNRFNIAIGRENASHIFCVFCLSSLNSSPKTFLLLKKLSQQWHCRFKCEKGKRHKKSERHEPPKGSFSLPGLFFTLWYSILLRYTRWLFCFICNVHSIQTRRYLWKISLLSALRVPPDLNYHFSYYWRYSVRKRPVINHNWIEDKNRNGMISILRVRGCLIYHSQSVYNTIWRRTALRPCKNSGNEMLQFILE